MNRLILGCLQSMGLAWLLAMVALPAHAHSSSNSYLTLSAPDAVLQLRTDINLRDVDVVFDLDANRDGQVTWAETAERIGEVETWVRQGVTLTRDGAACAMSPVDSLASQHGDGFYLSTVWRLGCLGGDGADGGPLALRYQLMFAQDNLHRGLLRVDVPGAQTSAILSPDQPEVQVLQGPVSGVAVLRRYVVEGVWHIWIGIDHILFLLSLLVLTPLVASRRSVTRWQAEERFRPVFMSVLTVVTAFTVAHSITLALSVLQWVEPPAKVIESVIALSVVLAALNNLLGWFAFTRWRLAFVFGLIHGFGFANVLLDLGLPAHELALALGGFNIGVELGQLAIVLAFMPVAWLLRRTAFYRWVVVAGGSLLIAVIGAVWMVQRMSA